MKSEILYESNHLLLMPQLQEPFSFQKLTRGQNGNPLKRMQHPHGMTHGSARKRLREQQATHQGIDVQNEAPVTLLLFHSHRHKSSSVESLSKEFKTSSFIPRDFARSAAKSQKRSKLSK